MMTTNVITTRSIAGYCNVTQRTAIQWINEGKIRAHRTPGNHIRIYREDFLDFLKRFEMPVPEELKRDLEKRNHIGRSILIVDDDKEMVSAIRRVLLKENFRVEVAYDGFTAGLRFNDFNPDMVLLDIKMPGFDGYEVCENIRRNPKNNDAKIVVISGMIDEEGIKRIKKSGADDVFVKPFDNRELLARVKKLLGWARRKSDVDV